MQISVNVSELPELFNQLKDLYQLRYKVYADGTVSECKKHIDEVFKLRASGLTLSEVGKRYNVGGAMVASVENHALRMLFLNLRRKDLHILVSTEGASVSQLRFLDKIENGFWNHREDSLGKLFKCGKTVKFLCSR